MSAVDNAMMPFPVPVSLHAENRARLAARFQTPDVPQPSVILLKGGAATTRYDTDRDILFRQESHFHWTFGVAEADCLGAIEVGTGKSVLFLPRLPASYAVWLGVIHPLSFYKTKYEVDETYYVDEIPEYMKRINPAVVYLMQGVNSDSGLVTAAATFPGMEAYRLDYGKLFLEICDLRTIKTEAEIAVMRYVCQVSSDAHCELMRQCKPGVKEGQLESLFLHEVYSKGGCRETAYVGICGSGKNGAILHYPDNDKETRDGQMILIDMGGEYYCYASDITCSYPVNGRFTDNQKLVYNAVLAAQEAVFEAMKPEVSWLDMHIVAERVIVQHLKAGGLLVGEVDELMEARIPALFMPHGLGHLMGLDVHDCGGYLRKPCCPPRSSQAGWSKLRTCRTLAEGMVLTVEPGVYFIDALLEPALKDPATSKFLNAERLAEFKDFGGVRIEDDVVVTETGIENFTKCPRTVEQIEACMAGKDWKAL
eukprot:GILK01001341.1.p1 GENE.GILK01001341.1~~GILK01001341.1.p1  ORF type:complete len:481 (-),score=77.27 GILK01001341.1:273-1715(-)